MHPQDPAPVVARLRAAGCVFAEDEAAALLTAATGPGHLSALVDRRVRGEPLEQVLGWAEFCGLRVAVEPGVFVPRRRTALLVEQGIALLQGTAPQQDTALLQGTAPLQDTAPQRGAVRPVVVDLCCGSGAVGLALADAVGPVELHATDVDAAAVRCARRNLAPLGGSVHRGDLYAALPAALRGRVDLLVANAPYVPSAAVALMPPEARDHEPRTALDGGPDGTDLQRRVAAGARRWLAPGGTLLVETSARQAPLTAAAVEAGGLRATVVRDDERDATVVVSTLESPVSESSLSDVTHVVTIKDGSVTR